MSSSAENAATVRDWLMLIEPANTRRVGHVAALDALAALVAQAEAGDRYEKALREIVRSKERGYNVGLTPSPARLSMPNEAIRRQYLLALQRAQDAEADRDDAEADRDAAVRQVADLSALLDGIQANGMEYVREKFEALTAAHDAAVRERDRLQEGSLHHRAEQRRAADRLRAALAERDQAREALRLLIEWNDRWPSHRVYGGEAIKRVAAELDEVVTSARAALTGEGTERTLSEWIAQAPPNPDGEDES